MFEVSLTELARRQRDALAPSDRELVEGFLETISNDPETVEYKVSGEDDSVRYSFAGPKRRWKISYSVFLGSAYFERPTVLVYSIKKRPTLSFDPRW